MINKIAEKFASSVSKAIVRDTKEILQDHKNELHLRFNELDQQFKLLFSKIDELEKRFETKEIKDRQNYGNLHYKIEAIKKDSAN